MVEAAGLRIEDHPVFVSGIRGYYQRTMGDPAANDRGIYDDAIFLVSAAFFGSYNGNTDPGGRRPGRGFGAGKGMARLKPGVWNVYRFDLHRGSAAPYPALCQRAGNVTVVRDGIDGDYEETGSFGINIHRGSWSKTSSLGCQTIYPAQWDSFITSARDQARRFHGASWKSVTIPYVLLEQPS
jgi:lysozyme